MFGIADLITVVVVEDGLQHLRKHPDQLNFILSPFTCQPRIRELVGARHLGDCVSFVTENRLHVAPYYEADLQKVPSLVIVSRTSEDQQFIGDYGYQTQARFFDPFVYTTFDIVGLEEDRRVLFVPKALHIEEKIWPNVWVKNGAFQTQVEGIHVREDADTRVLVKDAVPAGTNFAGWTAQSSARRVGYEVHSDIEGVEVTCKLTTSGDYSVHRLMGLVVRYCLKRGRGLFEAHGLQVPVVSQGMPMLAHEEQKIYESVFTVRGKLGEHWVANEFDYGDPSGNIDVDAVAMSEGKANVPLE